MKRRKIIIRYVLCAGSSIENDFMDMKCSLPDVATFVLKLTPQTVWTIFGLCVLDAVLWNFIGANQPFGRIMS